MKVLIAIVTCHAFRGRAATQRSTWARNVVGADVRFFLGGSAPSAYDDEVILDVKDDYVSLPAKVQAMHRWALAHNYDFVFKCDDDVYVQPERLMASNFAMSDYCGRLRGASGGYPAPYASGFGYWLSRRAMAITSEAELTKDGAEDRWVGNTLMNAGILCTADYRYVVARSEKTVRSGTEGPRRGNRIIAACEYDKPELMQAVHLDWQLTNSSENCVNLPEGKLDRVCILVKTFLRDGYLHQSLKGIQQNLPECKIVIVDDGMESRIKIAKYAELRRQGHSTVWLPFDSGFGAKANVGLSFCDREYVLVGSDDFDFSDPSVRPGILKMLDVMDSVPVLGSAAGRVDNRKYEGYIERGPDFIREHRLEETDFSVTPEGTEYKLCDLTVNYNLLRRSALGMDKVHWHAQWKIGGDHYTFYDDLRKAGWKIAWVPGVNINQLPFTAHWQSPEYGKYRARAKASLPSFFTLQGITRYIGFDGRVDTVKC